MRLSSMKGYQDSLINLQALAFREFAYPASKRIGNISCNGCFRLHAGLCGSCGLWYIGWSAHIGRFWKCPISYCFLLAVVLCYSHCLASDYFKAAQKHARHQVWLWNSLVHKDSSRFGCCCDRTRKAFLGALSVADSPS
ncbi:hypothetical protein BDQ12DRAFT_688476 [Crucibulum laeve]|uniref:Uncharacterized protein n=1 Tax=Crucibulum laeve TaxID=68775 RepID=A0A5C3LRM7_9AGAR|nr:hypothetical protein BDQ12DRAFT_688476 [Crucibulum laeve]